MTFKRNYCSGGYEGKRGDDDFVVGYLAENGKYINVEFLFGNESYREYKVDGRSFSKLAQAKAYCAR